MAKKTNFKVNGNEYFKVTRTIGHKADGTAIKKTFYGSCKAEAEEKADNYLNDIENGLVLNYENISLNDLLHTWIFDFLHNSNKIKPSTFQRYEGLYRNYIKESSIAGMKIVSINSVVLQKFYNELSKTHSYSQINYLNSVLKTFFNWCIDSGYVVKNPCLKVEVKGNKNDIVNNQRQEVEILSEEEIDKIKEFIKNTDMELLLLLDLATGLRQGELLALDWENIDLDKQILEVKRTVKEVYVYDSETEKHIETIYQIPKTPNSFRKVSIPSSIVAELEKQKNKKRFALLK